MLFELSTLANATKIATCRENVRASGLIVGLFSSEGLNTAEPVMLD